MKRELDWSKIRICLFLLAFMLLTRTPQIDASDNPAQEAFFTEGCLITGQRDQRSDLFYQCEGTDELIYFCYFNGNFIDAYDHSGNYRFTIQLPEARNGGPAIDCVGDLLIAQAATDDVFVFRGTELLEHIDKATARERGYRVSSVSNETDYAITRTHVVKVDGEELTELFPLPPEIEAHLWEAPFTKEQMKVAGPVFVVVFLGVWLAFVGECIWQMIRGRRKRRGI